MISKSLHWLEYDGVALVALVASLAAVVLVVFSM